MLVSLKTDVGLMCRIGSPLLVRRRIQRRVFQHLRVLLACQLCLVVRRHPDTVQRLPCKHSNVVARDSTGKRRTARLPLHTPASRAWVESVDCITNRPPAVLPDANVISLHQSTVVQKRTVTASAWCLRRFSVSTELYGSTTTSSLLCGNTLQHKHKQVEPKPALHGEEAPWGIYIIKFLEILM